MATQTLDTGPTGSGEPFWRIRAAIVRAHASEILMFDGMERGLAALNREIAEDRRRLAASWWA